MGSSAVNLFGAFVGYGGPRTQADGQPGALRIGKDGSQTVQDSHARYQEAVYRGNVFLTASQAAVTFSTGVTTTTVTGLMLINPPANTKNLVLWQVEYINTGTIVGFTSLAAFPYSSTNYTQTTTVTNVNALLGSKLSATGITLQGSNACPATPVVVKQLYSVLSTNTAAISPAVVYDIGGSIVLAPGTAVAVTASAGVTGLASFVWEEIPV